MIHPHYDVIQEYLANRVVQIFVSPIWKDVDTMQQRMSHDMGVPSFRISDKWRIKPKFTITETCIKPYLQNTHETFTGSVKNKPNLRMTWLNDQLIQADVI